MRWVLVFKFILNGLIILKFYFLFFMFRLVVFYGCMIKIWMLKDELYGR